MSEENMFMVCLTTMFISLAIVAGYAIKKINE